jgi:ribonucleoside-diphosphate reductase alpha chain
MKMKPIEVLQQIVHQRTYAKTKADGRKESREETISRCEEMHTTKFPELKDKISKAFAEVKAGRCVPSMRTLQFGGEAVSRSHARAYNCSFAALTSWDDFADLFYLLCCGTGAGYSVQRHHIEQLPAIDYDNGLGSIFVVPDSKEGWANAITTVLNNPSTELDVHLVRRKGEPLSSGGTASGPEALLKTIAEVKAILRRANGRKLRPIEAHDVMCHVADGVVVGGVRRAALISLFDADDKEMLTCKHGMWWDSNPQRARSNNSAVLLRDDPKFNSKLDTVLTMMFDSNCGEPGISLSNNRDMGANPCHEISLRDGQLCNLTEINVAACNTEDEFYTAVEAAVTIGTLQASYTDFNYIQDKWKKNCEEEALLGVSLTGQAQNWNNLTTWLSNKERLHKATVGLNLNLSAEIGINPAARIMTTKPSGSTSAWLGTTSGIHAAHSEYYIRRVRVDKSDPIAKKLENSKFVEVDLFNPENLVVSFPVAAPDAIIRDKETAVDLMERAKHIHTNWIRPGHISGDNTHNVSLTVSYKKEEEEEVKQWMSDNSDTWAGISLLPYDGGTYSQSPFEEISADVYRMLEGLFDIEDLSDVDYTNTVDERLGELACAGGSCEIK